MLNMKRELKEFCHDFFYVKLQLKSCLAHAFLGWSDLKMHAKLACPHFYGTDSRNQTCLFLMSLFFLHSFITVILNNCARHGISTISKENQGFDQDNFSTITLNSYNRNNIHRLSFLFCHIQP